MKELYSNGGRRPPQTAAIREGMAAALREDRPGRRHHLGAGLC